MANELIIAAAGSGKTREVVNRALSITKERVLITTFTEANESEINRKFVEENGCVPKNVVIRTWFSLLIKHGVKPYQSVMCEGDVKGLLLVNQRSGVKGYYNGRPVYYSEEKDFEKHYFTKGRRIYSDKLSKFVVKANSKSSGRVIDRLVKIFPNIMIDESQDLAGYDLEIVKLIAKSKANVLLVGDPRQVVYLTHHSSKYPKYKNGKLKEFIENECGKVQFEVDSTSLSHSYRCIQKICDFSNLLYPNMESCNSKETESKKHEGIFLVPKNKCKEYIEKYKPIQLVRNKSVSLYSDLTEKWNYGKSKGLTFPRVLIYPTQGMIDWIKDHGFDLKATTRAQFYVAITRAKYSVGIVFDDHVDSPSDSFKIYESDTLNED